MKELLNLGDIGRAINQMVIDLLFVFTDFIKDFYHMVQHATVHASIQLSK